MTGRLPGLPARRRRRSGFWLTLAALIVRPLSVLLTRRRWSGQENIPRSGGVILVANHISSADPLLLGHYVYAAGRNPRFMAKSELWEVPVIRRMLRGGGQIPVHRREPNAQEALRDAVAALRAGRALVIYPEGTITRDPDGWPMRARTGVARLALATGAPVVPIAQWGAQRILPRGGRLRLLGRPEIRIHADPPVDLSRFAQRARTAALGERTASPQTAELLREVTWAVMAEVTALLVQLRGEPAPQGVWDPEIGRRVPVADAGRADGGHAGTPPAAAGDAAGDVSSGGTASGDAGPADGAPGHAGAVHGEPEPGQRDPGHSRPAAAGMGDAALDAGVNEAGSGDAGLGDAGPDGPGRGGPDGWRAPAGGRSA